LGAHQHFIQPFKNAKFRPNYAQKYVFFEKKNCKIAAAAEAPLSNFHWPPAAGGSAPRPPLCFQYKGFQYALFILL